jgi:CheY-like chemotaxis protein
MTVEEPRPVPIAHRLAEATARQIAAVDAFHRARRAAEQAAAVAAASRETRMDLARRVEVLRRQHQAILQRAEHALRDSGSLLAWTNPRTAFIAHRQEWFTSKVTALLGAHGVHVLGHTDVGADVVGWALAEQPDLVLVEDCLAMVPGVDVVRQIRQYCDTTVIGALVAYNDRIAAMLEAGATTVHVRAVPPAQVVDDVVAVLAS